MDENDFDQILQTDFHPNTAPSLAHHHHEQDDDAHMLDPVVQEGQQQHADDDVNPQKPTDTEVHYDLSAAAAGLDSSSIGPLPGSPDSRSQHDQDFDHELGQGSSSTSTAADKKRKQRELNRLAATRSRRKKQGELGILENNVEDLAAENEKLRARMNALLADRPGMAASPVFEVPHAAASSASNNNTASSINDLSGTHHRYLRRFVTDLAGLKNQLIAKEIELDHARSRNAAASSTVDTAEVAQPVEDDEVLRLRSEVTEKAANLVMLQAEERAMESMVKQLRLEKDYLHKQRDRISREVDARMAIKQINDVAEDRQAEEGSAAARQETAVEKVLLEVRGVLDETIAKWNELDPINQENIPIDPALSA